MASPNSPQDRYAQLNHSSRRFRVRALPDSPTMLLSPGLRRVESSPPVVMGTPSPPLLPNNETLRVRKRRQDRSSIAQNAIEQDGSCRPPSAAVGEDPKHNKYNTASRAASHMQLPTFQNAKHSSAPTCGPSNTPGRLQKENLPVYFTQLTNEDIPPAGELQRRDSGKRKALVRMLDGAKSKYPRLSQRSLTSAGMLRKQPARSISATQEAQSVQRGAPPTPRYSLDECVRNRDAFDRSGGDPMSSWPKVTEVSRVIQPYRAHASAPPLAIGAQYGFLSIRLRLLMDMETLRADDVASFWVLVEAEAVVHENDTTDGPPSQPSRLLPLGSIRDVMLAVNACPGCTIDNIVGSNTSVAMVAYETTSIFVQVTVDRHQPIVNETELSHEDDSDQAFLKMEALLGDSLTPILHIDCRYRNTLLPPPSEVLVQDICFLRRTSIARLWSFLPATHQVTELPDRNLLHSRLIHSLLEGWTVGDALEELERTFAGHPCACPLYLEHVKRHLQTEIAMHGQDYRLEGEYDPSPLPIPLLSCFSRFPLEDPNGQVDDSITAFSKYPAHVMLPIGGLKARGTARSTSLEESDDRAREIWRHMRGKSRGDNISPRSSNDSMRELQNLDKPLWEIRKQALLNKRSVGADTLKSLAASTRRFGDGAHAPWL